MIIVEERYKYFGARGCRWTDWFKIYECENEKEALEYISNHKEVADGREIEFRYS